MDWIDQLKSRAFEPKPIATPEQIVEAQTILGFPLPEDLKRIYLNIGNGAFFKSFGLMSLENITETYFEFRESRMTYTSQEWPENILPFCSGGCDLLCVINLSTEQVGFIQYEIIGFDDTKSFESIIEWKRSSVKSWFESWMDNEPLLTYSELFWDTRIEKLLLRHLT